MGIDRREKLSRREFVREYLKPLRPVIVTDAIRDWPALGKWRPEFFRDHYGSLTARVGGAVTRVDQLVNRILASTPEHPGPYLHNQSLDEWPAELRADVLPIPACTQPNWLASRLFPSRESMIFFEFYMGAAGAGFPVVHYDGMHTHAYIMEIYGRKEFWVCPPDQGQYLYPRSGVESNKSQIPDVDHVDLDRFPLFAKATPTRFVLEPGETLFVPSGWWHTTRLLEPIVSVSVNSANAANWRAFVRDYCRDMATARGRARAAATSIYLTALGYLLQPLELLS
jgi:Cupin-like domain